MNGAAHTVVLAIGNPLRGDDGVGQAVADRLRASGPPASVSILDGGTAGLETVLLLQGYRRAIIVDSADMSLPAGSWRRFTPEEAELQAADFHERMTVHYAGLAEALALGGVLGILPEQIVVFGIQPLELAWTPGLSAPVEEAVPAVCAAILAELEASAEP